MPMRISQNEDKAQVATAESASNRGGKVNPKLAAFTPRQLMEELKARGYTGELKYTQTIKL